MATGGVKVFLIVYVLCSLLHLTRVFIAPAAGMPRSRSAEGRVQGRGGGHAPQVKSADADAVYSPAARAALKRRDFKVPRTIDGTINVGVISRNVTTILFSLYSIELLTARCDLAGVKLGRNPPEPSFPIYDLGSVSK